MPFTSVADLLSDPARWTQGAIKRDAAGNATYAGGEPAVCWCLDGAVLEVYGRGNIIWATQQVERARERLREAIGLPESVELYQWNDAPGRKHAEVLAAVVKAKV